MKNLTGLLCVLSMAAALIVAPSAPSKAEVIINNVFSPGTLIEVGPGYGYVGPRYYGERHYHEYPAYYEGPGYYGHGHYDRAPRGAYCWHSTDRDRGFGYWGRCHRGY